MVKTLPTDVQNKYFYTRIIITLMLVFPRALLIERLGGVATTAFSSRVLAHPGDKYNIKDGRSRFHIHNLRNEVMLKSKYHCSDNTLLKYKYAKTLITHIYRSYVSVRLKFFCLDGLEIFSHERTYVDPLPKY